VRQAVEASGTKWPIIEVFVDTPLEVCKQRARKVCTKKAIAGEIKISPGSATLTAAGESGNPSERTRGDDASRCGRGNFASVDRRHTTPGVHYTLGKSHSAIRLRPSTAQFFFARSCGVDAENECRVMFVSQRGERVPCSMIPLGVSGNQTKKLRASQGRM